MSMKSDFSEKLSIIFEEISIIEVYKTSLFSDTQFIYVSHFTQDPPGLS